MPTIDINLERALSAQRKITNAGTSEGVKKSWETRKISGDPVAKSPWNGYEYHGPGGKARIVDIPGDERREYHSLTHNGLINWSVDLNKSAPHSLHMAAAEAALNDAGGNLSKTPGEYGGFVEAKHHAMKFLASTKKQ